MPNWCANQLTAAGPRDEIERLLQVAAMGKMSFADAFDAASLITPDDESSTHRIAATIGQDMEGTFSFHGHVPEPTWASGDRDSWYPWRLRNWGTKWDARQPTVFYSAEALVVEFDTAWGPPDAWFAALVKAHPLLELTLFWNEEQAIAGCFSKCGGDLVHHELEISELLEFWPEAPFTGDEFDDDDEEADDTAGDPDSSDPALNPTDDEASALEGAR